MSLLKEDHAKVKELFDQFEKAKGRPAKIKLVRAALAELKVRARRPGDGALRSSSR